MTTYSKILTRISAVLLPLVSLFIFKTQQVSAQSDWAVTGGFHGDRPAEFGDLETIFSNLLGIIVLLGGIAVFVMLIKGGFRFMTSGGDPKATAEAKGTITWAIFGLILLLSIIFILKFIEIFTGIKVTVFKPII